MSELKYLSVTKAMITWDLKADESGTNLNMSKLKPLSATVHGDYNGASLVIEGNNDPDSEQMFSLNDPNGYPLTFQTSKIEGILEDCVKLRPRVIGGSPSTKLIVNLLVATQK